MEFSKIEILLEKYFQGASSIEEEKELHRYFSSSHVAPELEQYKPLFGYFKHVKEQKFENKIQFVSKKINFAWLSIAASVVVMLGIAAYAYYNTTNNEDLGTYNDPKQAFEATQKALAMLSNHVNVGVESVQYINEYENSKNLIFKQ